MRRPLIAGNWKMNCLKADGVALASGIAEKYAAAANPKCDVLVCPPAIWVLPAVEACHLYDLNRYAVSSDSVFKVNPRK